MSSIAIKAKRLAATRVRVKTIYTSNYRAFNVSNHFRIQFAHHNFFFFSFLSLAGLAPFVPNACQTYQTRQPHSSDCQKDASSISSGCFRIWEINQRTVSTWIFMRRYKVRTENRTFFSLASAVICSSEFWLGDDSRVKTERSWKKRFAPREPQALTRSF